MAYSGSQVPIGATGPVWKMNSLVLIFPGSSDDILVSVELLSARVRVTQPSEIALYLTAFEQLRSMAYTAEKPAP
jgi:hypothetical protein